MSLLNQTGAVIGMNIRSIPQRAGMSLATVIAIALVVSVLLGFLSLVNGLRKTLEGAGAHDVAIVLRDGAGAELNSVITREQVNLLPEGPGVAAGADGKPRVSAELYVIVDGIKKSSGTKANLPLRGLGAEGLAVRKQIKITRGRMFAPGSNEIVAGAGLLREFSGYELGKTVRFGSNSWRIVGVFESPGSALESELWADAPVVQSLFNRGSTFQTARVVMTGAAQMKNYIAFVKNDPRLKGLKAQSEFDYFAEQAQSTGKITMVIGYVLGGLMAIGALAGAWNTMYSSVSARAAEIATLRIIGFSGFSAFVGTMAEALALSLIGALVGCGAMALFFNGKSASTLGQGFTQVAFRLEMSPALVGTSIMVAMAIGLIGGFFPGWRAARQKPLLALAAQ